jgi:pimeloyl-ACP methyl ester carboxylesterase
MKEALLLEKSVKTKNGNIFYYLENDFPGKPFLIFIHGLSANHTTWLNFIKAARERGYNSLALDLRGHGSSDKARIRSLYDLDVLSGDLDLILKIEGIKNGILVGYSYGGVVAIDYAIKNPDFTEKLILISSNHANPFIYRGINFLTPICYFALNLLAFLFLWQKRKKYYYYRQGESRGYWHSVWIGLNTMPFSVNFWLISSMAKVDFRKSISRIKSPTLIVRAQNDPLLSVTEAEEMAENMPHAEILIPKHQSHWLASRDQEELSQIILDFAKK